MRKRRQPQDLDTSVILSMPMTNRRSYDKLMGYGGHAEKFDDWRFKIVNFLEEEPAYRGYLKELEQNKGVQITGDHLRALQNAREIGEEKPTTQWLDHHLYQVLVLNCSGEALAMVKTHKDDEARGANAWRALIGEAVGLTGNRFQGIVARVFSPERITK